MNQTGHNNPPEMTEVALETMQSLSDWMKDHPSIASMEEAREAKVFIDRAKLGLKDLDDERDGKVRPLNEEVKKINELYRSPKTLLTKVLDELQIRVTGYVKEEERKRIEAATAARLEAERLEQEARELEEREKLALESARSGGELDIDVAELTRNADEGYQQYEASVRKAMVAERETHVTVGGGFTRSISLRHKEVLEITDPIAAITEMGASNKVKEAIKTSARDYKKILGHYPAGVTVSIHQTV